jgi:hypothetical protein
MAHLKSFIEEILSLAREFPAVVFKYIPRSDNYRADMLVNRVLDEHPAPKFRGLGT